MPANRLKAGANGSDSPGASGVGKSGKYHSLAMTVEAIPMPPRVIQGKFAVRILDHVFQDPPDIHGLMETVELLLGGTPSQKDVLPPPRRPRFTYQIDTNAKGEPTVSLWIGRASVKLPRRQDIHLLLECFVKKQNSVGRVPRPETSWALRMPRKPAN